jgi:hypothetical protein
MRLDLRRTGMGEGNCRGFKPEDCQETESDGRAPSARNARRDQETGNAGDPDRRDIGVADPAMQRQATTSNVRKELDSAQSQRHWPEGNMNGQKKRPTRSKGPDPTKGFCKTKRHETKGNDRHDDGKAGYNEKRPTLRDHWNQPS